MRRKEEKKGGEKGKEGGREKKKVKSDTTHKELAGWLGRRGIFELIRARRTVMVFKSFEISIFINANEKVSLLLFTSPKRHATPSHYLRRGVSVFLLNAAGGDCDEKCSESLG